MQYNSSYNLEELPESKRTLPFTLPPANPFSRGAYRVWQRNRDAFFQLWKTELWPPFVEAVLTLLAFGFGLGVYIQGQVEGMSYLQFIAPGLVMSSVLFTASFECMFGTYIRMKLEKLFDAMIATPVSLDDVVSGEITWAATRAGLTGSSVLIVLAVLGLAPSWWVLGVIPVALLTGFMLASMAVIVTSLVPSINSFNYYITLGVIPMQLFSGIFFPVSRLPQEVSWLVYISPFYPAVKLSRDLFAGNISLALLGYLLWILVLSVIFYLVAVALMRRRIIH
ncbi:MAG TPA: ABC transporter permease [Chloroflexia bacterium]|nr:ABC transporter permease [Chloroflexia bacterium]